MFRRKRGEYESYLHELEVDQGIAYKPLVWSCFGRPHPEADVILESMAVVAARRRGLRCHSLLLRRTRAAVGVALVRRAVRMVDACLPDLAKEDESPVIGCAHVDAELVGERVAAAIDGEIDVAPSP